MHVLPTEMQGEREMSRYQPGDCVVDQFGLIKLADGREVMGILLRCPAGPPKHPISMAWDGTPFVLTPRDENASLRRERDDAIRAAWAVLDLATPPISDADMEEAAAEARRVASDIDRSD